MKRTSAFTLIPYCAAAICAAAIMSDFPVNAAGGDIVYSQNFDMVSSFDELGYTVNNAISEGTAQYSVENGALVIDNLDSTTGGSSDSYLVIADDSVMSEAVKGDYTIRYDVTMTEVEDYKRYITMLYNYDEAGSYNSAHIRWCGYGHNQYFNGSEWLDYEDIESGNTPFLADQNNSLLTRVFGVAFDGTDACVTGENNLGGRTMTIEIRCYKESGPDIYVNGILVSKSVNASQWTDFTHSAVVLKASTKIKGYVDNIIIYEGCGVEPNYPVEEIEEIPVADDAAAEIAVETVPETAAQTFDSAALPILALLVSGAALIIKKRK